MAGKIITKQKRIGQLGVNLIERIALRMGFKPQQMNAELDTGIDGLIEICDPVTGQALNHVLFYQSRARREFDRETDSSFEYACGEDELSYWLSCPVPVLLIVSRSHSVDEAYWIEVKSYFADPTKLADRLVRFNKQQDRFDINAAEHLRRLAVPRDSGVYFPSGPAAETLISNLFRIAHYPRKLYIASTDIRSRSAVWAIARESQIRLPGGEWFLKSKQITSIYNLRDAPWPEFVDVGTVEEFDACEWAQSADQDRQNEFIQLLRLCLQERLFRWGVRYSDSLEFFYFLCTFNKKSKSILLPGSTKPKTVFTPYQSRVTEGRVSYYRHQAFYPDFHRIADDWYLGVTPTYHFTRDGKIQSRFAGELTQGIKRLERQLAVVGHLRLWEHVLTNDRPLTEALWSQGETAYPHLHLDPVTRVEFGLGIDDITWLKREEKDRAAALEADADQLVLFDRSECS